MNVCVVYYVMFGSTVHCVGFLVNNLLFLSDNSIHVLLLRRTCYYFDMTILFIYFVEIFK